MIDYRGRTEVADGIEPESVWIGETNPDVVEINVPAAAIEKALKCLEQDR
jgi:hypothetical protein